MTPISLRAGALTMVFEPDTAFLRDVRLAEREVLRGIFGAVRDRNWNTVPPQLDDLRIDARSDGFRISFDALCQRGDVDFIWRGEVTGIDAGTVSFVFDGAARSPFLKNRVGLCVLHPVAECAGQPCRVEHVDGRISRSTFPRLISPHQPFRNVGAITHEVVPGVVATVTFAGDVFEMEDQRNWTDASFKTYGTPLDLPFPVPLERGARVRQMVTLQLDGGAARTSFRPAVTEPPCVRVDWGASRPRPPVGFGLNPTPRPAGCDADTPPCIQAGINLPGTSAFVSGGESIDTARAALALMRPGHLRVDLHLASADWRDPLRDAIDLATRAGARLHVAAFVSPAAEGELEALLAEVTARHAPVGLWLVFQSGEKVTSPACVDLAVRLLARFDPDVPVAAGTNAYFAELNRNRPPPDARALPCFSITPQVHAFDNRSLVETLGAQRSTVESTRTFSSGPVVISPITLRPRFNPNATEAAGAPPTPESDPRQTTAFGAAWTVGTLARLATCPDVHSLTFYETAGPRGVMDEGGRLFPVGHVFAALAGWDTVAECVSSAPLQVDALGLCDAAGRRRMLLAGFTAEPQQVVVSGVKVATSCHLLTGEGFTAPANVRAADGGICLDIPPESVLLLDLAVAPSGDHGC